MCAVFDEAAHFQRMLDVEATLTKAQARLGIIPAEAAKVIAQAARYNNLDPADLAARARNVAYPVGLVAGLSCAAAPAGRWTQWGAPAQDATGLADCLGGSEAHHVVKHACDVALAERVSSADALLREPAVTAKLDRPTIKRLTRPSRFGSAMRALPRFVKKHAHYLNSWCTMPGCCSLPTSPTKR